jgi:hypothetical protein
MLRIREAVDDPLAHREVEAEDVHEPTMRTSAIGRRDSDLVWPAAIDRGGSQLAFPAAHGASPIDSMFSFCSISKARRECIGTFKKSEAETAALLEAEIDARLCALS